MAIPVLLELSRYLLRALVGRPGEARVEHLHSGGVDFLFFEVAGPDEKNLSERDKEALASVVERIGKKLGHEVIVDWR
ncbi:MAG: hypothetical protein NZ651_03915 [Candidatus Bipolaricaulota bacterium]|nr:hypothetical protein [Candidatus Bipolaricaulota bacterium]MDW8126899.1 hypothetical protein [Candidatus Bipolaricaulota bacterium]